MTQTGYAKILQKQVEAKKGDDANKPKTKNTI